MSHSRKNVHWFYQRFLQAAGGIGGILNICFCEHKAYGTRNISFVSLLSFAFALIIEGKEGITRDWSIKSQPPIEKH